MTQEKDGPRSAPLKIVFWCICPRTGDWRYGYLEDGDTMFFDAQLVAGSNLKDDIEAVLDTEGADYDFIIDVGRLGPWEAIGWLTRTNFAYCQIDLTYFAIERAERELPQVDFLTLDELQFNSGIGSADVKNFALAGELALIEKHPPVIHRL